MKKVTVDKNGRTILRDERGFVVEKSLEDLANFMQSLARVVIEIDENANVLNVEIIPFGWYANYLVVIGPVETKMGFEKAIRLEIGFERSVPYQPFRLVGTGHKRSKIFRRYVPLKPEETLRVLPSVSKAVQEVTDSEISKWKNGIQSIEHTRPVWKGGSVLLKGLKVTVSRKDAFTLYAFLLKIVMGRKKFLIMMADDIKKTFKGMKRDEYSNKQLLSFKSAGVIRRRIHLAQTKEQLTEIKEYVGKEDETKERMLFDAMLKALKVKLRKKGDYEKCFARLHKKFERFDLEIIKCLPLSVALLWKDEEARASQAKNCYRPEIHPSRMLIDKLRSEFLTLPVATIDKGDGGEYDGEF